MAAESLVAVLGLKRLLDAGKVLKRDVVAATGLEDTITTRINQWVAGEYEPRKPSLSIKDYEDLRNPLVDTDPVLRRADWMEKLQAEDLDIGVALEIERTLETLRSALPKESLIDTGMGSLRPLDTSVSSKAKFIWVARLIDDPLWIIDLMAAQQIAKSDSLILQEAFPEIFQTITAQALIATIDEFNNSEYIPRKIRLPLSVLLQTPIVDVRTAKAYQEAPESPKPESGPNLRITASEREGK